MIVICSAPYAPFIMSASYPAYLRSNISSLDSLLDPGLYVYGKNLSLLTGFDVDFMRATRRRPRPLPPRSHSVPQPACCRLTGPAARAAPSRPESRRSLLIGYLDANEFPAGFAFLVLEDYADTFLALRGAGWPTPIQPRGHPPNAAPRRPNRPRHRITTTQRLNPRPCNPAPPAADGLCHMAAAGVTISGSLLDDCQAGPDPCPVPPGGFLALARARPALPLRSPRPVPATPQTPEPDDPAARVRPPVSVRPCPPRRLRDRTTGPPSG